MELGEKLRQARLEAGLSQRQLSAGIVTRNMLSLIENGSAKPSMDTLKALAARLGKSAGFFLEEEGFSSPNAQKMEAIRQLYDSGDFSRALEAMNQVQMPDPVFHREYSLLRALTLLELAREALDTDRHRYALELLDRLDSRDLYCRESLCRQALLLRGRIPGQSVSRLLPSLDEELLLRAEEAFASGTILRARQLLDAAQDRNFPRWNFLMGQCLLEEGCFREAAECLHKAESAFPGKTAPLLERCYRELEDYRRAYEYACKQK